MLLADGDSDNNNIIDNRGISIKCIYYARKAFIYCVNTLFISGSENNLSRNWESTAGQSRDDKLILNRRSIFANDCWTASHQLP